MDLDTTKSLYYDIDHLMQFAQQSINERQKLLMFRIGDDAGRVLNFQNWMLAPQKPLPVDLVKWIKQRRYLQLLKKDAARTLINDVINSLKRATVVGILDYEDGYIHSPEHNKRPALDKLLRRHNIVLERTCDAALSRYIHKHKTFWNLLRNNKFCILAGEDYINKTSRHLENFRPRVFKNLVAVVVKNVNTPMVEIRRKLLSTNCSLIIYCIGIYKYELYRYDCGNKVFLDIGQLFKANNLNN